MSRDGIKVEVTRRADWLATRQNILDAARACFSARGYHSTTTKDVAAAADVAEVTLFRHFPTKAQLFEEAAIQPLNDFLNDWIVGWTNQPPGSRDVAAEGLRFYSSLMDLLIRERNLVATLLSALAIDQAELTISAEARAFMSELLARLEGVFAREGDLRGYTGDPHVTPRLIMAMALGIATHSDWLFGTGRVPTQDHLVAEMSRMTVYGLGGQALAENRSGTPGAEA